jgi:hypothetical protein
VIRRFRTYRNSRSMPRASNHTRFISCGMQIATYSCVKSVFLSDIFVHLQSLTRAHLEALKLRDLTGSFRPACQDKKTVNFDIKYRDSHAEI